MNYIKNALNDLHIPIPDSVKDPKLGDNLGMDSQEIIELITLVEDSSKTTLDKTFFDRSMSISEAEEKLEKLIKNRKDHE